MSKGFIPFRYQGQYEDIETGLYYNHFRYYSPESGTYISQDPIRLAGGLAFYGYVFDCNGWIDPWGLENVYVVYQAPVLDANGVPTGEIYTGRTYPLIVQKLLDSTIRLDKLSDKEMDNVLSPILGEEWRSYVKEYRKN